ncbi:MAG: flagellar FliJ family protein [Rhodospirillaceae bacterium]|nr:flagellar FliJ family protein [Rhodospirillaceae bacterium]MBT5375071.1 flagellar FliJ family protein [Rhodospirillaceae bacterium]MBT5659392.1 flagellar FliJ family protein [Rhodospirillaceae bacterium]MBT5753062.1 flagellar FliJ family protein [Rhodospirillaceae bacterium]
MINLIRMHRWRLDEKSREIVEYEELVDSFVHQGELLEDELKAEQVAAKDNTMASLTYGEYANSIIQRREKLGSSISQVEQQIQHAKEDLRLIFQELKRYEILKKNQDEAALEKANKLEQSTLDELGIELFRRRDQH